MGECIISRRSGSGGGLNFSVVVSADEPSPKNNLIWLESDVPVNAVYFTKTPGNWSEVPDAAEIMYEADDTYDATSASAAIMVNRKSKIGNLAGQMWCILLKAFIAGKPVNAYLYKANDWVKFSNDQLVLIQDGELNPDYEVKKSAGVSNSASDMQTGFWRIYSPAASSSYVTGYLNPQIDLSGFQKLIVDWDAHGYVNDVGVIEVLNTAGSKAQTFVAKASINRQSQNFSNRTTSEIDISAIKGEYYIGASTAGSGGSNYTGYIRIYSLTLM